MLGLKLGGGGTDFGLRFYGQQMRILRILNAFTEITLRGWESLSRRRRCACAHGIDGKAIAEGFFSWE